MRLRVIAGKAGGLPLESLEGKAIRPTAERVRAALFSILAPRIEGARFLDLYAGTGANGIEALSRGANYAVFVERDKAAAEVIGRNLARTGFSSQSKCILGAMPEALDHVPMEEGSYSIVFADPPYRAVDLCQLLIWVKERAILEKNGILIVEHAEPVGRLADMESALRLVDMRKYGSTCLSFFS